jgi:Yip1 domain
MEQTPLQLPPAPALGKTISDVFASPSEAFQSIKNTQPSAKLWLVPMLLMAAIVISSTIFLFTNDALKTEFKETQSRIYQQKVEQGKMTQTQAEQAESAMDSMGGLFIVIGIIGGMIAVAAYYFGAALVLWLVNKSLFKAPYGYMKYLELYSISTWIGVLGGVITVVMMLTFGTMTATPSAALAVLGNYDATNTMHKILSAFNVFSIWETAVIGIGLSKFSEKSYGSGIASAFILLAIWTALSIGFGFAR